VRALHPVLERLRGGLVVSCQARPGHPLRDPARILAMAEAAAAGGAAGLRLAGEEDIRVVRAALDLPIIGLRKVTSSGFPVYITPTLEDARAVVEAGADLVAVDATARPRPGGVAAAALIAAVRAQLDRPVLADVSTVAEGVAAAAAGADAVATTLAGYTGPGAPPEEPDVALVEALVERVEVPVIAEGRYRTPQEVARAFQAGAFAVVVGRAITDPVHLTRRFVAATPRR